MRSLSSNTSISINANRCFSLVSLCKKAKTRCASIYVAKQLQSKWSCHARSNWWNPCFWYINELPIYTKRLLMWRLENIKYFQPICADMLRLSFHPRSSFPENNFPVSKEGGKERRYEVLWVVAQGVAWRPWPHWSNPPLTRPATEAHCSSVLQTSMMHSSKIGPEIDGPLEQTNQK